MPGLVVPYGTVVSWSRKNFRDLPAIPGKIVRFIGAAWTSNMDSQVASMMGFDLTGPWR
ncbi:hypothetical protein D3C85_1813730 [compost metagenome]